MSLLQPAWREDCRGAATLLGAGRNLPTPQMADLVDAALRKIVQARDGIIGHLRESASSPERDVLRAALDQLNVTLSELASVQYPGALDRQHVDTARDLLHKLMAEAETIVAPEMAPLRELDGISGTIRGGLADQEMHRIEATSDTLPRTEPRR